MPTSKLTPSTPPVEVYRLNQAPYVPVWDWQRQRAAAVAAGDAPEAVLLVEHLPVYTTGRRGDPANLGAGEAALRALGAEVHWTDRGGDVTWHGPGQLVVYPILDLNHRGRDLHAHVHGLEQVIIDVAASYGITAGRAAGKPGVWVNERKLAALGVRFSRGWVSYHGFALNVAPDLRWFEAVVPCGIHGAGVTSLALELGAAPSIEEVAGRVQYTLAARFSARLLAPRPLDLAGDHTRSE